MTKLVPWGLTAAASFVAPSIALIGALAFPAIGSAEEGQVLTFSPAPVSFAKTTAGAESQTQTVDVYNGSGSAAAIDQVVVEGADSGEFKVTGDNCGWLDPDQHCSLWVAFAPSGAGTKTATLSVKLKEAPEQAVQLEGEAVPAQLVFTPGSYDFGIQRVNRGDGSANLQLSNAGEAPTQLGWLGISGPDTSNFWTNGGDCWNGRWLAPGESCNVQVGFNPWDIVAYEAEVQARVNGATFAAPLTGTGGRAIVAASSNPTDFGSVPVGSAGPVETIVFTNNGNIASTFFIAVIAGGSVGSFQLIDEDCTATPLDPGASCTAQVRFAPQGPGLKAARLALFGDDEGGTMLMLTGEGVAATASEMVAGPTAASEPGPTRRGKHRRFARGDDVGGTKRQRPQRVNVRASSVPR